jgi:flagellar hook-associated protein 3 FlgL
VTDALGNDITAETPTNGTFDSKAEGGNRIAFRGVEFEITVTLQEGDDPNAPSPAMSSPGAPDSLTTVRGAGNPSSAQITSGAVTDPTAYRSTFPDSGAVIKFTGPTLTSSTRSP